MLTGIDRRRFLVLLAAIAALPSTPLPADACGDRTGRVPQPRTSTRRSHDDPHR